MGFPRQEYWSGVPLPSPHGTSVGKAVTWELLTVLEAVVNVVELAIPL